MLVVLLGVFVLWVAFLLTMYFTTVYPHRHIEMHDDPSARAAA